MMNDSVRVYWRAAIMLGDGDRVIPCRSRHVSRLGVTVGTERHLPPGHRCTLALILPQEIPGTAGQVVEGKAEVVTSVLAGMHFDITVRWLEMDDYCRRLLDEQIHRLVKR